MADQGRKTPQAIRDAIFKMRCARVSIRNVMKLLGVSKSTVEKYAPADAIARRQNEAVPKILRHSKKRA